MKWRRISAIASLGCLVLLGLYTTIPNIEENAPETLKVHDILMVAPEFIIYGKKCRIRNYNDSDPAVKREFLARKPKLLPKYPDGLGRELIVPQKHDILMVYPEYIIYGEECRIRSYNTSDPAVKREYPSRKSKVRPGDTEPYMSSPMLNLTGGHSCDAFVGSSGEARARCTPRAPTQNLPENPKRPDGEHPVPRMDNVSMVYEKYLIYGEKCRIRNFDYNDPAVKKQFFSREPKMCPRGAKPFVFYPILKHTEGRSCVGLDVAAYRNSYARDFGKWKCTYKETSRDLESGIIDRHYKFGVKKTLNQGACPDGEFIWIECTWPGTDEKYEQPLVLPLVKPARAPITPNNIGKRPLHVAVVGLDSVSRLNAYRQFPRTMQFLKSKPNLIELFGYNKIGLNSQPNQIPLLTGIPFGFGGLEDRVGSNNFDNLTRYLWDFYGERGYRTMFYEEQWMYGLFLYPSLRGFRKVPTTYWPRPIMQAIDRSTLKRKGADLCIGPDFPAKLYLDYTYNTMKILGVDRPLFSYSWLSETAHDDVGGGKRVDKYFHDFFTKMESDGILNNTAVFFISDHGFRFGSFRGTELGSYEDMLPYGFVLMPDWYYDANPFALDNMRVNSRRLVTVYDLYATLLELAEPWSESRVIRTANGYSLLSNKIPSDRSCEDAGIDFQFCSCFEPQPLDSNGDLSRSLADSAIADLNMRIQRNNATAVCREWSLDEVHSMWRLSQGNEWTDYYKTTLQTSPPALFELAAQRQHSDQGWKLLSDVDRIDRFDTHAWCVEGTSYEKFCYCK